MNIQHKDEVLKQNKSGKNYKASTVTKSSQILRPHQFSTGDLPMRPAT